MAVIELFSSFTSNQINLAFFFFVFVTTSVAVNLQYEKNEILTGDVKRSEDKKPEFTDVVTNQTVVAGRQGVCRLVNFHFPPFQGGGALLPRVPPGLLQGGLGHDVHEHDIDDHIQGGLGQGGHADHPHHPQLHHYQVVQYLWYNVARK